MGYSLANYDNGLRNRPSIRVDWVDTFSATQTVFDSNVHADSFIAIMAPSISGGPFGYAVDVEEGQFDVTVAPSLPADGFYFLYLVF